MDILKKYGDTDEQLSYKQISQISKAMSSILRHNAKKYGLQLRPDGYISVDELLAATPLKELKATAA